MISIEAAQRTIFETMTRTSPLPVEDVPLLQGLGRIIAQDIRAPWDLPLFDCSAMDGYAFSSQSPKRKEWTVVDFIPAGSERTTPVQPGEMVKIMTGVPIPPGCDTVVPVEAVEQTSSGIRLTGAVKPGSHIRKRGENIREHEQVIAAGSVLRPQEIALLTSLGLTSVAVFRRVRVAILATGDELLDAGTAPSSGKIINSNSNGLAALVFEAGGEPLLIGIAADTGASIQEKIQEGLRADMLITSGGVSMGDRDLVKESILKLGGELYFEKVNVKPGKPVTFAVIDAKPVFALPGNPVAAMVAFEMFVRPALLRSMGHSSIFRPVIRAVLADPITNLGERPLLARVRIKNEHGVLTATSTGSQSSANLVSLTRSNALLLLVPGSSIPAGSTVEVMVLDHRLAMDCSGANCQCN
jgi:molybdopterin molybdotransferase